MPRTNRLAAGRPSRGHEDLVVQHQVSGGPSLTVERARSPAARSAVYRLRHTVYGEQARILPADHPSVRGGLVHDPFDDDSEHLLLRVDGEPVGSARFTEHRRGPLELAGLAPLAENCPDPARMAEVNRLLVLRSHRGTLAGPLLLWAAWRTMHGSGSRYVWVASEPGRLTRLYKNVFAAGLTLLPDLVVHPNNGRQYHVMMADIGDPGSLCRAIWRLHELVLVAAVLHTPIGPSILRRGG